MHDLSALVITSGFRIRRGGTAATLALVAQLSVVLAAGQSDWNGAWPAGQSPEVIGRRVSQNWQDRSFVFERNPAQTVRYFEACTWYGALALTAVAGPKSLNHALQAKLDFLGPDGRLHVDRDRPHVGYSVFGLVPLEIFLETHDRRYLEEGLHFADGQWRNPSDDGITGEARYWIDDIYMIVAVQTLAFRATGDRVYLDRAALTMDKYVEVLQQPNGLVFHAPDSPFFWSRGNGWLAASLAELLPVLPVDHPRHASIMRAYQTMMKSLLGFQAGDGAWRQLIDQPDSWVESSGTGMFAFAIVTGVKHGWLDASTYGPAARRAWLALAGFVDDDGNVNDVCIGTNKAFGEVGPDLAAQKQFYLDRRRVTGDLHGQAAVLWAATALLRED